MAVGTFLELALLGCGIGVIVAGLRWLEMNVIVRERIMGEASVRLRRSSAHWQSPVPAPALPARRYEAVERGNVLSPVSERSSRARKSSVRPEVLGALALAGLTFGALWLATGSGMTAAPVTLAVLGSSWAAAAYTLQMRAKAHQCQLLCEWPLLLDLMLLLLESGVPLEQVFRDIATDDRATVPAHAPLLAALVEDLVDRPERQPALERWAARVGVDEASDLAAVLGQPSSQEVELVPALREFIRDTSQRRIMRATAAVGPITARMVMLMLLFFLPALFIVLAGPPAAAIFDMLRHTTGS